jgi:hypothetical protein
MNTDWVPYMLAAYWIPIGIGRYIFGWDTTTQIKAGFAACILFMMVYAILKFRDMRRWDKLQKEIDWV